VAKLGSRRSKIETRGLKWKARGKGGTSEVLHRPWSLPSHARDQPAQGRLRNQVYSRNRHLFWRRGADLRRRSANDDCSMREFLQGLRYRRPTRATVATPGPGRDEDGAAVFDPSCRMPSAGRDDAARALGGARQPLHTSTTSRELTREFKRGSPWPPPRGAIAGHAREGVRDVLRRSVGHTLHAAVWKGRLVASPLNQQPTMTMVTAVTILMELRRFGSRAPPCGCTRGVARLDAFPLLRINRQQKAKRRDGSRHRASRASSLPGRQRLNRRLRRHSSRSRECTAG
jgi:hypothetical protein